MLLHLLSLLSEILLTPAILVTYFFIAIRALFNISTHDHAVSNLLDISCVFVLHSKSPGTTSSPHALSPKQ